MNIRTAISTLLAVSLLAPLAAAQQQQPPATNAQPQEDVVRVTTNLVQIDVIVTDKEGRQVTDLRPEEFEISESGKRQQITNFSYISAVGPATGAEATTASAAPSAPGRAPVPPAPLRREQVRRTIALVVDDLGLSFESMAYVRSALKRFVDEQMQPNDMVAVLRTGTGSGALQQFTSDKRQLHATIDRLRWFPAGRAGVSTHAPLNEDSAGGDKRDAIQFIQEMEETRAGVYSAGTFNSVVSIVRGLGEMPGRKSLVLFSEAFQLFTAQGRNLQLIQGMERLTTQANAASVSIYTVDASGLQTDTLEASDQPGAPAYTISPQDFATAAAAAAGRPGAMPVNAAPRTLSRADTLAAQAEGDSINAFRRLNAMMDQRRQERYEAHTVLSYLAAKTGGLFMRNRNDLANAVSDIMNDQRGYYLIGYRPDDNSLDPVTKRRRMRDLEVKVKRPGLKLRTREGYFGVTEGERRERPATRDAQLSAALLSPFASGDVRARLTSLFGTDAASGAPFLRSLLHVDARDVTFKEAADGSRTAEIEVLVVAFGADGRLVNQVSYPETVRATAEEFPRVQQNGLTYILNFPVQTAGAYQMRVAVRDAGSERTGSALQFVEVPDLGKGRLALSGIVLSAAAPEADPQAGPAVRRLRQGMTLDYRYNIYNAKLDPSGRPQVTTQMRLFRDGKPVFTGKVLSLDASQQQNMKRLNAAGRLRLGPELTPGDYVLQVTVTDALAPAARRTTTQWIDFEIAG
ncbi:MAG TPA: VWA domain-containing protein [Pyrinomonadaceae bacterium]|nr:VWA domain-containing protein [Pyrinomonadaceae bacterium]